MYEVKIVDRKKIKKKRERVNKTARVRASIWNRNMSAVQWIVHFFRFFWVCVYHSTTKQFSHWNWYTKRTIHNSVCTALGCVCAVCADVRRIRFIVFLTHCYYTKSKRTRVNRYKHKNCIHRWVRTNTHLHTHTRARQHIYLTQNLFCGPRIEHVLLDRSDDRCVLNNNNHDYDKGRQANTIVYAGALSHTWWI